MTLFSPKKIIYIYIYNKSLYIHNIKYLCKPSDLGSLTLKANWIQHCTNPRSWYKLITSKNIFLESHLVLPKFLKKHALSILHSAHYTVKNMQATAKATIYWPGMNDNIQNTRYTRQKSKNQAPSQSKKPIISPPAPGQFYEKRT